MEDSRSKRNAHHVMTMRCVHARCVEGVLGLGGHVVIGVVRCHHVDVIPSTGFFPSGFCSSLFVLVVRLYSVIVNSYL